MRKLYRIFMHNETNIVCLFFKFKITNDVIFIGDFPRYAYSQ